MGMILTSVFAKDVGLIFGQTKTFLFHILALVLVGLFSYFGSYLLFMITNKLKPLRVRADEEAMGLDQSQHGESIS